MTRLRFAVLALGLVGCAAKDEPPPSTPSDLPHLVVAHDAMDAGYVLAGAAIQHDDAVHLWAVLFEGEAQGPPRVVHLTSPDARAWQGDTAGSVLDGGTLGLDATGAVPSSVLVEADGTWRLFGGGRRARDGTPVIWTATAPGPDGPWTFHDAPILEPEGTGWDGEVADHPSVVRDADGYLMAYGGAASIAPNRNRIGFARSTDAITWERVPATLAGADDDEALGPTACGIDARSMVEPELHATDAGYRLDFGVFEAGGNEMLIGTATSADGLSWTCLADGPVLGPSAIDGGREIHSFLALTVGGRERFLVELLGDGATFSDLWLVER